MKHMLIITKKADLPSDILSGLAECLRATKLTSDWSEVMAWGSCKLFARKRGCITQYARRHYGYYDCCRLEEVRQEGHALNGLTVSDLPRWAMLLWNKVTARHAGLTFVGFERPAVHCIKISVRDSSGDIWIFSVYKSDFHQKRDPAAIYRDMWQPIVVAGVTDRSRKVETIAPEELLSFGA